MDIKKLNARFTLFKQLSDKAIQSGSIDDYKDAESIIDFIFNEYIMYNPSKSEIENLEEILETSAHFFFKYSIFAKEKTVYTKLYKSIDQLIEYFPKNFHGLYYSVVAINFFKREDVFFPNKKTKSALVQIKRYFQSLSQETPFNIEKYYKFAKNIYLLATVFEKDKNRYAIDTYRIIVEAFPKEFDSMMMDENYANVKEKLRELQEIYFLSEAKTCV